MEYEFDPGKDAANIKKHGVPLSMAADIEWDTAYAWVDERFACQELRMCALDYIGTHLYHVAFVDHEIESDDTDELQNIRRIISLRRAEKKEYRYYANA